MEEPPRLEYEEPLYRLGDSVWTPIVFDAGPREDSIPQGFNAVRVPLDGSATSDLDWESAVARAQQLYRDQGLYTLWDLDLGLFARLGRPLSDEAQFHALRLSVMHFVDAVWKDCAAFTAGLVLYRGAWDFSLGYPWDAERRDAYTHWLREGHMAGQQDTPWMRQLFCRDSCSHYLHRLTQGLPGGLVPWILGDGMTLSGAVIGELARRDLWTHFARALNRPLEAQALAIFGWDAASQHGYVGRKVHVQSESAQAPTVGVLLPGRDASSPELLLQLQSTLDWVVQNYGAYRLLTEQFLTAEWDHLQQIYLLAEPEEAFTQRKLRGFAAAGGELFRVEPSDTLGQVIVRPLMDSE